MSSWQSFLSLSDTPCELFQSPWTRCKKRKQHSDYIYAAAAAATGIFSNMHKHRLNLSTIIDMIIWKVMQSGKIVKVEVRLCLKATQVYESGSFEAGTLSYGEE